MDLNFENSDKKVPLLENYNKLLMEPNKNLINVSEPMFK